MGVILTAQLMLQMDFLIVTVALPQIQADLGFSAAGLSWVPNAFALSFGGLLLLGGRLGALRGRVRAFQIGIALFVAASMIGGLAQNQAFLVAARLRQGVGAAFAVPSVLALIAGLARTRRSATAECPCSSQFPPSGPRRVSCWAARLRSSPPGAGRC
ncbi:MFS transporter [Roseomonas sp. E05]|uniref:MFS transporter n=1 Tax=Roseomonas sp. E05 TaxID=3046310 RepID=UPI0038D1BC7D